MDKIFKIGCLHFPINELRGPGIESRHPDWPQSGNAQFCAKV